MVMNHSDFQLFIDTYVLADKAVFYIRIQNFEKANYYMSQAIRKISEMIEIIFSSLTYINEPVAIISPEGITNILENIMTVYETQDYILLADLLELQFLPIITDIESVYIQKEGLMLDEDNWNRNMSFLQDVNPSLYEELKKSKQDTTNYELEYSGSGSYTMAVTDATGRYYYHSNKNSMADAYYYYQQYVNCDCTGYIVYGLGLGTHLDQIIVDGGEVPIEIFESDIQVIHQFLRTRDVRQWLDKGNVKITYDRNLDRFIEAMSHGEDKQIILHQPSIRHIKDDRKKDWIHNIYVRESGIRNARVLLHTNFHSNQTFCVSDVEVLRDKFVDKTVYIVAAGPSLDKNVGLLKVKPKNALILATGTVYRKLMKLGIQVDYVVIADPNPKIRNQIQGLEGQQIPLLLLSTAYQGFAKKYAGDGYIIYQEGFKKAEEYAKINQKMTFDTGGSVSTLALDICIQFKCSKIVFVGLDLAYTNNFAHADGTSRRVAGNTDHLKKIPSIDGGKVPTSHIFEGFIRWFEQRLRKPDVTMDVIDATEGGALITGMKIKTLRECMSE